jgi:hypothetical protein
MADTFGSYGPLPRRHPLPGSQPAPSVDPFGLGLEPQPSDGADTIPDGIGISDCYLPASDSDLSMKLRLDTIVPQPRRMNWPADRDQADDDELEGA